LHHANVTKCLCVDVFRLVETHHFTQSLSLSLRLCERGEALSLSLSPS